MTDYSILPTRTDGSLGRTKSDPEEAIALDYQESAAEFNTRGDWIKHLAEAVGPDTGYSEGTLRWLVEHYGSTSDVFHFRDHFTTRSAAHPWDPFWDLAVGASSPSPGAGEAGGWAKFPADSGVEVELRPTYAEFYRAASPILEVRVCLDSVTSPDFRAGFWDAAHNDGFGVLLDHTDSKFKVWSRKGGTEKTGDTGVVAVAATDYVLRVWLTGAVGSAIPHVTVDGDYSTEPTVYQQLLQVNWFPFLYSSSGADAGLFNWVDRIDVWANFGAADT